jgi:NAD+ kinase
MTRFKIIARDDSHSLQIQEKLTSLLLKKQHQLDEKKPNIVFFVGGDGTFLRSIQDHLSMLDSIIFVGIHSGTLGFFCEYSEEELEDIITNIDKLTLQAQTYRLIELELVSKDSRAKYYAVNEVRVENPFLTLVSHVEINHYPLETFRGSGLIVSSTLGSSAYNKSLGGALVDVQLETLQLTEMAAIQNNAYRSLGSSLILDGSKVITFRGAFDKAIFGYDYQSVHLASTIDEVNVSLSKKTFKLVHQIRNNYYQTIKNTFVKNK